LLLNFLLIQENLTPSLTFDPWYLSYSTVEELPDLVREGQAAYEKYFVSQLGITKAEQLNEMTNPALKKRYVGAEKQVQITVLNLCGILCLAWQIKAIANSTNADLQMHKQYLQNLLGDTLDLVYCSDYEISLKDILPYQLSVETKSMIGEVALQGALSLFDRDALEADKTELGKKYKIFFDAELYEKDEGYKDEKIGDFMELDLVTIRKDSIDVIVDVAERLCPGVEDENFYEENLMEKYCNDEQFRYRVLEELPQEEYKTLFQVEVLNSLIPFCDRPVEETVLDFDYEAIRTRLYEKRLFDFEILSKKTAWESNDYRNLRQNIGLRFSENLEIKDVCDRYFQQVEDFYDRFSREITFEKFDEYLKEIEVEKLAKEIESGFDASTQDFEEGAALEGETSKFFAEKVSKSLKKPSISYV